MLLPAMHAGTPFQESKRKAMIPVLYFRMLMWILQAAFNGASHTSLRDAE